MKRILFALILLSLSTVAQATPGKTAWTQVIFIGANETHYCTYLIVRDQPGSYYTYTDRVYLCRYDLKDNVLVDQQLVRETVYRDTTTNGDWRKQDKLLELTCPPLMLKSQAPRGVFLCCYRPVG